MSVGAKRNSFLAAFQPRHVYLPGTDFFRRVDVDVLAARLNLDARGAADGEAGAPRSDSPGLTASEREIDGELRRIWDEAAAGARRAHDAYRGRLASLTAEGDIDTLFAQPKSAAVTLRETAREERDRLVSDYETVRASRAELERFRRHEGLTRPPREEQSAMVKAAFLAAAALVELIVNTSIFAGGDEFGFAGAITKVLLIPIVNIGGCWLFTHWLARQILARSAWRKLVGVLGIGLVGVWLLGLNLGVAHWRDSADALLNLDAAQSSLDAAVRDPLRLKSFQSWGLFLVGCFAGAVAIYEGWMWRDPHPGYADRAGQARRALEAWRSIREAAIDRLQLIADRHVTALEDAQRRVEQATAERPALAGKAESLAQDLALYADHLRHIGGELVARYRAANLGARTGPAPVAFEKPVEFVFAPPDLAALSPARSRSLAGRLARAMNEINAALAEACASLPSASELETGAAS
jgi:hypothetical protein